MKKSVQRKKRLIPRPLMFVLCLFLIAQVVVANRLATSGIIISEMESQISELTEENHDIKEKVASQSSLMSLKAKASEKGFNHPSQPVFLTRELPVALELR